MLYSSDVREGFWQDMSFKLLCICAYEDQVLNPSLLASIVSGSVDLQTWRKKVFLNHKLWREAGGTLMLTRGTSGTKAFACSALYISVIRLFRAWQVGHSNESRTCYGTFEHTIKELFWQKMWKFIATDGKKCQNDVLNLFSRSNPNCRSLKYIAGL